MLRIMKQIMEIKLFVNVLPYFIAAMQAAFH